MDPLKIIQFTDIHLPENQELWEGIDVRENFRKCWKAAVSEDVDLVVLSGDIAAWDGEEGSYLWLKDFLANETSTPFLLMSGNHDRVEGIEKIFGTHDNFRNGMLYGAVEVKGRKLCFLDSTTDSVPSVQLRWLEQELASVTTPIIFFMHHPPVLTGHKFMDTHHPLQNHQVVWDSLVKIPCIQDIFVGHYHYDAEIVKDGKNIYVGPSTKMQIDPSESEFKLLSTSPGWREIVFDSSGLKTEVKYLD
ncbi:MAG: 3',5'-cyclic-nucleotide phosphodiesterase [Halobacteriovoraceae bacterium]|jgi:3',5'-cyclic-AMP phosphodiesterase|nr:3',5'-cyclic-nucleotide phosphodiesterase [Halobacteriovoraceae bacterium]MBT5092686.1 3',5'-cyclic-nucleotide phosphodiesterase [Halobacteriovoraceae bacterium]